MDPFMRKKGKGISYKIVTIVMMPAGVPGAGIGSIPPNPAGAETQQ